MNKKLLDRQMKQLETAEAMVQQFRIDTRGFFAEPSVQESLLFALTEIGEAIDAQLRTDDRFARNNSRNISVVDELTDVLFMLASAWIQIKPSEDFDIEECAEEILLNYNTDFFLVQLMYDTATMYQSCEHAYVYPKQSTDHMNYAKLSIGEAMLQVMDILDSSFNSTTQGITWEQHLHKRLNDLINKHGAEQ